MIPSRFEGKASWLNWRCMVFVFFPSSIFSFRLLIRKLWLGLMAIKFCKWTGPNPNFHACRMDPSLDQLVQVHFSTWAHLRSNKYFTHFLAASWNWDCVPRQVRRICLWKILKTFFWWKNSLLTWFPPMRGNTTNHLCLPLLADN